MMRGSPLLSPSGSENYVQLALNLGNALVCIDHSTYPEQINIIHQGSGYLTSALYR